MEWDRRMNRPDIHICVYMHIHKIDRWMNRQIFKTDDRFKAVNINVHDLISATKLYITYIKSPSQQVFHFQFSLF